MFADSLSMTSDSQLTCSDTSVTPTDLNLFDLENVQYASDIISLLRQPTSLKTLQDEIYSLSSSTKYLSVESDLDCNEKQCISLCMHSSNQ